MPCLLGLLSAHPAWPAPAAEIKHVLLLHSYHREYPFTMREVEGIQSVLGREADWIEQHEFYLDAKRITNAAYLPALAQFITFRSRQASLDAVLVTDNDALHFAVSHRSGFFAGVPVFFAGIDDFQEAMLAGETNITGVVEDLNQADTINLALELCPSARRVVAISDGTTTGRAMERQFRQLTASYQGRAELVVLSLADLEMSELLHQVRSLRQDSVVLLLHHYRDRTGRIFSHRESLRLIPPASPVPVFVVNETRLGTGALGGYVASGFEHGRQAARMVVRVLKGESPAMVPILRGGANQWMFDYAALQRWKINEDRLPAGSQILNRPRSYYARHRSVLLGAAGVTGVLTLVILLQAVNLARRKKVEESLRQSEARFRQLLESSPVAIAVLDAQWRTEHLNQKLVELLGYALVELPDLEQWWVRAFPEESSRQQMLARWQAALAVTAQTQGRIGPLEADVTCKDGSRRCVEAFGSRVGNSYLMVLTDLTDHKKAEAEKAALEEQFRQAQKMEAVGRLAGGVAHDFNNLLTVILGFTDTALLGCEDDPVMGQNLGEIRKAGERASALTRQLLAFSRRQVIAPAVLDLNEVITQSQKMLGRLIGEDIELAFFPGAPLDRLKADPSQLEQIIVNLAVNARDAMPNGGRLTLETANVFHTEDCVRAHTEARPGRWVMLAISDSGHGMTPEVKKHLFEPFFTTKDKGKGTGLGLATIYGIVKQSQGFINVYSEVGVGTTFRLYFPPTQEATTVLKKPEPRPLQRGQGTILLVEDEEMLRRLARRGLERMGYRVLVASDGATALEVFQQEHKNVSLLVTDVIMPGMNGRELLERLQATRPDLKALFMSGYTDEVIAHHGILDPGLHFIQKPYGMAELGAKIEEVLQS